jgi:G3E family GTPase
LHSHQESLRQAAVADRIVITKSDLVPANVLSALKNDLEILNPTAWLYDAQDAGFETRMLLVGGLADPSTKLAEVRRWLDAGAKHGGHDHHRQSSHRHGSGITSVSLRVTEPIDWAAFGVWLTILLHRHGRKVLRVKGLLNVSDALGPVVLHGVQHIIHPPMHLEEWPDQDMSSRIAFIIEDIDPDLLQESLLAFLAAARRDSCA